MALKSMSIEKLVALKDQIEAMLSSKVVEQRRALESELAKLGRFQGGKSGSKASSRIWRTGRSRTQIPQSRKSR